MGVLVLVAAGCSGKSFSLKILGGSGQCYSKSGCKSNLRHCVFPWQHIQEQMFVFVLHRNLDYMS